VAPPSSLIAPRGGCGRHAAVSLAFRTATLGREGKKVYAPSIQAIAWFFLILPISVAGRSQVGTSTNNKRRAETLDRDDGGKKLRPIK